jgi:hypothetical protein
MEFSFSFFFYMEMERKDKNLIENLLEYLYLFLCIILSYTVLPEI